MKTHAFDNSYYKLLNAYQLLNLINTTPEQDYRSNYKSGSFHHHKSENHEAKPVGVFNQNNLFIHKVQKYLKNMKTINSFTCFSICQLNILQEIFL